MNSCSFYYRGLTGVIYIYTVYYICFWLSFSILCTLFLLGSISHVLSRCQSSVHFPSYQIRCFRSSCNVVLYIPSILARTKTELVRIWNFLNHSSYWCSWVFDIIAHNCVRLLNLERGKKKSYPSVNIKFYAQYRIFKTKSNIFL